MPVSWKRNRFFLTNSIQFRASFVKTKTFPEFERKRHIQFNKRANKAIKGIFFIRRLSLCSPNLPVPLNGLEQFVKTNQSRRVAFPVLLTNFFLQASGRVSVFFIHGRVFVRSIKTLIFGNFSCSYTCICVETNIINHKILLDLVRKVSLINMSVELNLVVQWLFQTNSCIS